MKKLTKAQTIARAGRVERLLANKDLQEAFQNVHNAIHEQINNLPPSDVDGIIECKRRLHVLNSVEENLKQAIQDGKVETFRTEQEKRPFLGDLTHVTRRSA